MGNAKIVEVKGMPLEADFHPVMLLIDNLDKPGFIGALGTILGEANINIATLHLGRQAAAQDAIAIVGVDQCRFQYSLSNPSTIDVISGGKSPLSIVIRLHSVIIPRRIFAVFRRPCSRRGLCWILSWARAR